MIPTQLSTWFGDLSFGNVAHIVRQAGGHVTRQKAVIGLIKCAMVSSNLKLCYCDLAPGLFSWSGSETLNDVGFFIASVQCAKCTSICKNFWKFSYLLVNLVHQLSLLQPCLLITTLLSPNHSSTKCSSLILIWNQNSIFICTCAKSTTKLFLMCSGTSPGKECLPMLYTLGDFAKSAVCILKPGLMDLYQYSM